MTPYSDGLDFGGFNTEEMQRLYNAVYESVNKFHDTPAPEPLEPEKEGAD